jgi:DNA-binding HxlR family transcriptional regulator
LKYLLVPIGTTSQIKAVGEGLDVPSAELALDSSVAGLLKLLGTGVAGPILAALARKPLRTQSLTDRLSGCAPRTVYRHAGKLAQHGLVVREEEDVVPSVVIYSLSAQGRELFRLLDAQSPTALALAPQGDQEWWASLALLGEMWSSGWIAALNGSARSATELSEMTPGMSFHQASRRVHLLRSRGLLRESAHSGRGKRYKLTQTVRRRMGLIAGIGCWRERNGASKQQCGLTTSEASTALRAALPLVKLDEHPSAQIKLGMVGARDRGGGGRSEVLLVKVGRDGFLRCASDSERPADGWAAGTIDLWLTTLIDGNPDRMRLGGDLSRVSACLSRLHAALWSEHE